LSIDLTSRWYFSNAFGRWFAIRRKQRRALSERKLYKPIRNALERYFCSRTQECWFDITAESISERVQNKFLERKEDYLLFLLNRKEFRPDIMGYVKTPPRSNIFYFSEFLTVVEVKSTRPSVRDLFQIKKYGELYNALISILISIEKPEPRFLALLEGRPTLLQLPISGAQVYIARFSEDKNDFDWWHPRPPRKRKSS